MIASIVDTGPLVAALRRDDPHHEWAKNVLSSLRGPLLTCEAVLTETCHLLRKIPAAPDQVFELVERGALVVRFEASQEIARLRHLMAKYRDEPMSFADACVVRMAEMLPASQVLTLDSDFLRYRIHGRSALKVVMPRRTSPIP